MTTWVGLIVLRDKKILMVKEHDKDFFVLPGGRIEEGEDAITALQRELQEEISVLATHLCFFNEFELLGRAENERMTFLVYTGDLDIAMISPVGEIEKIAWVSHQDFVEGKVSVGSLASKALFPHLIEKGLFA